MNVPKASPERATRNRIRKMTNHESRQINQAADDNEAPQAQDVQRPGDDNRCRFKSIDEPRHQAVLTYLPGQFGPCLASRIFFQRLKEAAGRGQSFEAADCATT